ncbi:MAG: uroporphyrinogen-III C-methyltransferase, partial [Hyphomicrobiales bacterium]|nr:uroporphyrinogen-III C-methyltransferase [Hyphomicrobiales bacterium]
PQEDARVHALAKRAKVPVNVAADAALCDFVLPSIVDRDPVMVAISTGGASPLLGRMLKARIEAEIPAGYGRLGAFVRERRGAVKAKLSDPAARRRFWEGALEGPIAEFAMSGDEIRADAAFRAALDRAADDGAGGGEGEVYLVGAGPGDPDLLTLRALRLMQKAEVVLYDHLVDPSVLDLVRREAERVYVGKRSGNHALPQEEIGDMLVRFAKAGRRAIRLKGGDPFVFGRGGEEIETLAANGVAFQVCPGVTAAIGCAAYAGIPLTHRDHAQSCAFVTAHGRDGPIERDWTTLVGPGRTLAIYMGLSHLDEMLARFAAQGIDPHTPVAIVENGTRANQRVVVGDVATIGAKAREASLHGPTIIVVGTVVTLRDKLNWRREGTGAAATPAPAPET